MQEPSGEAYRSAVAAFPQAPGESREDNAGFYSFDLRWLNRQLQLGPLEADLARVRQLLLRELTGGDRFLADVMSHLVTAGGKLLRPMLTLFGAYGGQRGPVLQAAPEAAIVGAAALEALHLCTLYHDDVMDEAALRRGVPSANARWGNTIAVIGGDMLLARAFRLGASIGSAGAALLAETLEDLCAGQARELSSMYDPRRDEAGYMSAIAGKTAALMAASLRVGGLASSLGPADLEGLAAAGHELGMAFQLIDDLLDLAGSTAQTGKPSGTDLAEGVYTLPVIVELRTNPRLRELLASSPLSAAEAEEARRLVMAGTGPAVTAERARQHVGRAQAMLGKCQLHPVVQQAVSRLGHIIFEPVRSLQPSVVEVR